MSDLPWTNDFIRNKQRQMAPDWQVSAGRQFAEAQRNFRASQQAKDKTNKFKMFIKNFVKSTDQPDIKTLNFDIDRRWAWENVKSAVDAGLAKDDEAKSFLRHPFRFIGRSFVNNASNLELLLAFIPDTEFTSVLCGGLTLIFRAAAKMGKVRKRIIKCLQSLPELVQDTEQYVQLYADDQAPWQEAESLYVGILEGVEAMLAWIDKKAFSAAASALAALFLQDNYGKEIEENVIAGGIEDRVARFRKSIDLARERRQLRVAARTEDIYRGLTQLFGETERTAGQNESILTQLANLPKRSFLTADHLKKKIRVSGGLAQADMEVALVDVDQAASRPLDRSRIAQILAQPAFAGWLQGPESQILYINGQLRLDHQEQETASPLTLLACALYQFLQQRKGGRDIPAMHLCGQHVVPGDPFASVGGLMRSLAAQILHRMPADALDLSFIDLDFVEGLDRGDPSWLSKLLAHLVLGAASAGRRVVLIVDGVSWLEEGPAAPEFRTLVDFCQALVRSFNARGLPSLKVLFTNPGTSIRARQWLADCPPSSILDLAGDGMAGQGGDDFGYGDDYYDDQQI